MKLTLEDYELLVGPIFRASDADIPNDLGCAPDKLQHFIDLAIETYPNSRYTAIRDWTWVDITVPENQVAEFQNAGIHASIVCTSNIIVDNPDRHFNEVTSTYLQEFTHNCLFRTRNTTYILCGPGRRIVVPSIAYNLAFGYIEFTLLLGPGVESS